MIQKSMKVQLDNGLEARPVAVFVQVASQYESTIYVEVDDGVRLQRALDRERAQEQPKYAEMCRRFLADEQDFSEENLQKAEITKRFLNKDLDEVTQEIASYIR